MGEFKVEINFEGEVTVVRVVGRLDRETSRTLENVTATLVDATGSIVFDFEAIGTVDDFGVDGLERCMRRAARHGLRVGFRNTRRNGDAIAARYGIDQVAPVPE